MFISHNVNATNAFVFRCNLSIPLTNRYIFLTAFVLKFYNFKILEFTYATIFIVWFNQFCSGINNSSRFGFIFYATMFFYSRFIAYYLVASDTYVAYSFQKIKIFKNYVGSFSLYILLQLLVMSTLNHNYHYHRIRDPALDLRISCSQADDEGFPKRSHVAANKIWEYNLL